MEKQTRFSRRKVKTPLLLQVTPKRTRRNKSSKISSQSDLELGLDPVTGHKNIKDKVCTSEDKEIINEEHKSTESSLAKEFQKKTYDRTCPKKKSTKISFDPEVAGKTPGMINVGNKSEDDPLSTKVIGKNKKMDHMKDAKESTLSTDIEVKTGIKTRLRKTNAQTYCTTKNNIKTNKKTVCKIPSQISRSSAKYVENIQGTHVLYDNFSLLAF